MGLFKQMKQMKEVVAEAPSMVSSAMAMQQAQADAARGAAAATTSAGPTGPTGAGGALDGQEIAGVSLATYAEVCKTGTERGVTDLPGVAAIARERGIEAAAWEAAMNGWNARFGTDTAAAMRFNALWRGVG